MMVSQKKSTKRRYHHNECYGVLTYTNNTNILNSNRNSPSTTTTLPLSSFCWSSHLILKVMILLIVFIVIVQGEILTLRLRQHQYRQHQLDNDSPVDIKSSPSPSTSLIFNGSNVVVIVQYNGTGLSDNNYDDCPTVSDLFPENNVIWEEKQEEEYYTINDDVDDNKNVRRRRRRRESSHSRSLAIEEELATVIVYNLRSNRFCDRGTNGYVHHRMGMAITISMSSMTDLSLSTSLSNYILSNKYNKVPMKSVSTSTSTSTTTTTTEPEIEIEPAPRQTPASKLKSTRSLRSRSLSTSKRRKNYNNKDRKNTGAGGVGDTDSNVNESAEDDGTRREFIIISLCILCDNDNNNHIIEENQNDDSENYHHDNDNGEDWNETVPFVDSNGRTYLDLIQKKRSDNDLGYDYRDRIRHLRHGDEVLMIERRRMGDIITSLGTYQTRHFQIRSTSSSSSFVSSSSIPSGINRETQYDSKDTTARGYGSALRRNHNNDTGIMIGPKSIIFISSLDDDSGNDREKAARGTRNRVLQESTQHGNGTPTNNDEDGSDSSSESRSHYYSKLIKNLFQGSQEGNLSYYYAIGQSKEISSPSNNKQSNLDDHTQLSFQLSSTRKRSSSSSSSSRDSNSNSNSNNNINNMSDIDGNNGKTSGATVKNIFKANEKSDTNYQYAIGYGDDFEERNVHYQHAIGHGDDQTQPNKEQRSNSIAPKSSDNIVDITNDVFSDYDDFSTSNNDKFFMCLVPRNECCFDRDCINNNDGICVHRNCIDNGYLRFTLQWIGDDDYDLFVVTPDGAEISYNNFFDPASMGKFGESVDQVGYGYHVENIYFPVIGALPGIYRFFARPFLTVKKSDEWTITVVEDGKVMVTETGLGPSDDFFYEKGEYFSTHPISTSVPVTPSPTEYSFHPTTSTQFYSPTISPIMMENPNRPPLGQEPTPSVIKTPTIFPIAAGPTQSNNEDCNVELDNECCVVDLDCNTDQDICEQRTCIKDGNPRFTLIWNGDNDLGLFVKTPDGVQISADDTFDTFSGGRYERDMGHSSSGQHVINIYFPMLDSPVGTYEYGVRSNANNDAEDSGLWYIDVYDEGDKFEKHDGLGDSITFSYFRRSGIDEPQRPDPQPPRCSPVQEECCIDSDCSDSSGDMICVQRTCINEGSLRITLEWIGDDDLQLYVENPDNAIITRGSDRYQSSSSRMTFGFHVESVYFPTSGAPVGTYRVYVSSLAVQGVGSDVWTMKIYDSGKLVQEETEIGNSDLYSYNRVAPTSMPSSLTQMISTPPVLTSIQPSMMPTAIPEPQPESQMDISLIPSTRSSMSQTTLLIIDSSLCTVDSDCIGKDGALVCAQNICLTDGNPRFTLQWSGRNTFTVSVITPDGTLISASSPFDPESGGSFERSNIQHTSGNNVENVHFSLQDGPPGLYTYYVTNLGEPDDSNAFWTVTLSVNGEYVAEQKGSGDSSLYSHQFGGSIATSNPQSIACETNVDCGSANICIMTACIQKGSPQFVLSWEGNSDIYTLLVVTPLENTIGRQNPVDAESGGKFNDHGNLGNSDQHIENIYFAPEGQSGIYPYYVHSFLSGDEEDTWTVTIYVDGEEVNSETGQESSEVLFYVYSGIDSPALYHHDQETCDPLTVECCTDAECLLANEICGYHVCIQKGAPQFVLSWEGNLDNYSLFVVTPLEITISWQDPIDLESGGKYNEHVDPNNPDHRIENIYFAPEAKTSGIFPYYVHSNLSDGEENTWTLSIFVDGKEINSETGQGSSEVSFFDYYSGMDASESDQEICDPPTAGECCTNADCFPNEACGFYTCVDEGNPRFTLSWEGSNDLDLLVITPLETVISFSNLDDLESGGKFGGEFDQFEYGRHAENIYFPMDGGPIGQYSFYVRNFLSDGDYDQWTVGVYVDGEKELLISGSGNSQKLTYNFLPLQ